MNFGEVTGLHTNLQKTSITPIGCSNIDIEPILAILPVARTSFPLKYLGLPLTPRRLRKLDFQPLIDKASGKLSSWNGRNLIQAGRVCLTKSVLSSQPVYLMTALKPPKEVLWRSTRSASASSGLATKQSQGVNARLTGRKQHY